MKKNYIQPDMEILVEDTIEMLAASSVDSEDLDIEYGGVDEGILDPAARESLF